MKQEQYCGLLIYTIHNDNIFIPVFVAEDGNVSIPLQQRIGEETEEEAALLSIQRISPYKVWIHKSFRHEYSFIRPGGTEQKYVYFLAEIDQLGHGLRDGCGISKEIHMGITYALQRMSRETDREVIRHAIAYLGWKWYHESFTRITGTNFRNLRYREHAVDIHSHVLPGMDDGAQTEQEAGSMIYKDWTEGVDVLFATPHYGAENGFPKKPDNAEEKLKQIRLSGQTPKPCVQLHLGTEWYCSEDIVERIQRKEAWPMGKSDWYMVEFLEYGDHSEKKDVILKRLKKMRASGINTILAHPERYQAIQQDWELAKRIRDLGVLMQVNAYDLFLSKTDATRKLAQYLAKEKMISFLGSDMHGTRPGARDPRMHEGIQWLYENVDEDYADDVVRRNAEKYLCVEELNIR